VRVARVFPTKTRMCPDDPDAYFGEPDLFTPQYDEVWVSVAFTWDVEKGKKLVDVWKSVSNKVFIGGCAFNDRGEEFKPGIFLKKGVVITSRGCPNNCSFCFVPKREGKIRELPITEGNIIQDNNLLATSVEHRRKVFEMLKGQRMIDFAGGFEGVRVTDEIVEDLRGLRIYQIWLAYDHPNAEKPLREAVRKLSKYFKRDKLRCYVLIGYENDTLEKAECRLQKAWEIGTLPFAMRYRTGEGQWAGTYLFKERAWNLLQRQWTRPAIIKSLQQGAN
jgi:hypothetical protein